MDSKNSNPKFTGERHIFHYTFLFDAYAVSVFVPYPPFFNSIFRQTNTPFSQNRQYPTPFYLSVLYYHGNPGLLRESILLPDSTIFPQSPSYQRHPKTKKLGPTTHRDEPHQTSKSLDFKPFFNTFACEYQKSYGIIFLLPPVPLLYFDDFYPGVKIFTPFTPAVRNLPHPICGSTNCDFAAKTPLFFCGIRYRMISAERSAAFDNSA